MVQTDEDTSALSAPVMEFVTEPRAGQADERTPHGFVLDGQKLIAYMPTVDQLSILYRSQSRTATDADKVNAAFEFAEFTLAPGTWEHVRARIVDPRDSFDVERGLRAIIDWIIGTFADENGISADELAAANGNPQAVRRQAVAKAQTARKPAAKAAAKPAAKTAAAKTAKSAAAAKPRR